MPSTTSEKDWDDVLRYQLGAEYALNPSWKLRAGYVFDETPDPDENVDYIVPGNDRHLLSAGVGYQQGDFFCDLAYVYLIIVDRDIDARVAEGVWSGEFSEGDAHMVAASVGYKL